MESLDKIQNGNYNDLRKNDVSRFVANDILRKGNQFKSYETMNPQTKGAFTKIPADIQNNLEQDAMKIQKLKMNLNAM